MVCSTWQSKIWRRVPESFNLMINWFGFLFLYCDCYQVQDLQCDHHYWLCICQSWQCLVPINSGLQPEPVQILIYKLYLLVIHISKIVMSSVHCIKIFIFRAWIQFPSWIFRLTNALPFEWKTLNITRHYIHTSAFSLGNYDGRT